MNPQQPPQQDNTGEALDYEAFGCLLIAGGLCANADTERWNPKDIAATALNITRATLNHLKERREAEKL